eukprot:202413_1
MSLFRGRKNDKSSISTTNHLKSRRKRRKKRNLFKRRKNNFPQIPHGMNDIVMPTCEHNQSDSNTVELTESELDEAQYMYTCDKMKQHQLGSKYKYICYIHRSLDKIVKAKRNTQ